MLYTFLLVLLIIDSLVLIAAVLLQAGQGGGMAASFGGVSSSASSFLGTRQAGNLLTKASWWGGGLFLGLSFLLALASTRSRAPKSVLDQTFAPAPVTAPANAAPASAEPGDSADARADANRPRRTSDCRAEAGPSRRPLRRPRQPRSHSGKRDLSSRKSRVPPPRGWSPFSWKAVRSAARRRSPKSCSPRT